MRLLEKRRFEMLRSGDRARLIENVVAKRCEFVACWLSDARDPARRTHVRNVRLERCVARGSEIGSAILEDVVVDGLDTKGSLLEARAAAYKHVTIRGKVGRFRSVPWTSPLAPPDENLAFAEANRRFYQHVDWALDISEAEFQECDILDVPVDLVRRDPETMVIVRRERLFDGRWRSVDLTGTWWKTALEVILDLGIEASVLVAPQRDRSFRKLVDGLRRLQDQGIADP